MEEQPSPPLQNWDAERYAKNARFVSDLGAPVVELLAPKPGERILDLGCGDGALTRKLMDAGASVLGVDASPQLVAAARARGVDARVMDARRLELDESFDAVFSNAALHWIPEAADVIRGVARVLKPGGRFVGEFGGHGNVAAICTALVAAKRLAGLSEAPRIPWYFPTPEEYQSLLEGHGFRVEPIELIPRPTPLPTGMRGWLETFADPLLAPIAPDQRAAVLDQAVHLLTPTLRDGAGQWTADYVRLRFRAVWDG